MNYLKGISKREKWLYGIMKATQNNLEKKTKRKKNQQTGNEERMKYLKYINYAVI